MYSVDPYLLIYLTAAFVIIILCLVLCIIGMIGRKKHVLQRNKRLADQLSDWLAEIILEETKPSGKQEEISVPADIQILLSEKAALHVVLNELTAMRKKLKGSAAINLEQLYVQLRLDQLSLKKLQSRRWHIVAKGIQELTEMKQEQHLEKVHHFVNHSNQYVRMEAQTGLVQCWGFDGLQFLDFINYPLVEWQQLQLLQLLSNHRETKNTPINSWLKSSNDSVVSFALKLVKEQWDAIHFEAVVRCLSHKSQAINMQAVQCLGAIDNASAVKVLVAHYAGCSEKVRECIIRVLQKIGTKEDLHMIMQKYAGEDRITSIECLKWLHIIQQSDILDRKTVDIARAW